jgi:hypothetical protein
MSPSHAAAGSVAPKSLSLEVEPGDSLPFFGLRTRARLDVLVLAAWLSFSLSAVRTSNISSAVKTPASRRWIVEPAWITSNINIVNITTTIAIIIIAIIKFIIIIIIITIIIIIIIPNTTL